MAVLGWMILFLAATIILAFKRAALSVWAIGFFVLLLLVSVLSHVSIAGVVVLWILYAVIFVPLLFVPLRRKYITKNIYAMYRKVMPSMSKTEREALSAGGVGWERELFSGMPDWREFQKTKRIKLTAEEQAFLEGPVQELCGLICNWTINHRDREIPEEIWQHLKKHGFLGLIIPKQYGGKQFSALAHSQIIVKVASVSVAVGCVVSVPNSLGPAELLLEYGTEEQKNYYLPRLARGEDIPCFALTSPLAGSDASAIEDHGVVCKKMIDGKEQIGIVLNWNKRYITLSPIATILGLAFKLYDPHHLIGDKENIGITCALIPVNTPGVVTGRRHFPLCSHFPNGPTQGKDVFVPLDYIIGGVKMAGTGWRMLMECLAAGRSISLPSMATGGAKKVVYTVGAYARIRRQFNTPIGTFGGVQEALSRILGYTYLIESLRLYSVCSIDNGIKSAVSSAICKYHTTEHARQVINDSMDIHGGKAICMGPNNYIAQSYIEGPISITVEGANILTRNMIIFGQGAIRAHPFVLEEMMAAQDSDEKRGLKQFDHAFFKHMGMIISNKARAFSLALTSGFGAEAPRNELKRYYQQFSRFSAAFSFIADITMLTVGAALKRKERLSARLGDMLSLLFMGSAALKYYEFEQDREALPVIQWVCQHLCFQLQTTIHDYLHNLPNQWIARWLRLVVFPLGRNFRQPSDRLSKQLAMLLLEPSMVRHRLTQHLYVEAGLHANPLEKIQTAFVKTLQTEPLYKRLQQAKREKIINGMTFAELIETAVAAQVFNREEANQVIETERLRMAVINVDDFSQQEFVQMD
ncbi:MAG: hypothetical protein A3F10_05015 [Coxiella sp. RIFCSPHIGHO2_12_FULL_42_15]|nr:MAG: hypothetical protein A3F10_05015 [Coxiella sp. RIFCSPHIGHO2_12_FULL_42_15]